MSIVFFADNSLTTTKKYDSWSDFFHPIKNPVCFEYESPENHGQVLIADMIKILTQFWCDENINDWDFVKSSCFFGSLSEDEHHDFLQLANHVPADKRWTLSFLNRNGKLNDRFYLKYQNLDNKDIYRRRLIQTNNSGRNTEILSFHTGDSVFTELNNIVNYYHNYFTDLLDGKMYWHTEHNGAISHLFRHAIQFLCNYPFVQDEIGHMTIASARTRYYQSSSPEDIVFTPRFDNRDRNIISILMSIKVSKRNRSALYNIKSYTTDVLSILPYPLKEQKENNPLLVGVELEVCTDYHIRQLVDAAEDVFFLGKSDSSITGNKHYCVELVTAPASIKYLKRQYALWFNNLDYSKFDTSTDTNNGMHVHVGREHFRNELGTEDKNHIRNFCWFINNPANTDFFVYLSERGSLAKMQSYTPFYQFSRGSSKLRAFKEICSSVGSGGFRGATNFKGGWDNAKTVEVRIFKGIVSYACIVKNLEVVDSVFHFTRSLTSYRDLTLKGYLKWLSNTPRNKYSVLKKFIDQADISKFIVASDVRDLIFNEDNPEKIVEKLNKAPFKLTNDHVTYLNRGRKRTFVLNKETGQLNVDQNKRSKVAFLDKEIAARYLRAS